VETVESGERVEKVESQVTQDENRTTNCEIPNKEDPIRRKTKMMKKALIATLATMWISVAAFAAPITYRLSTPGVV
jgi:hypothetical protein